MTSTKVWIVALLLAGVVHTAQAQQGWYAGVNGGVALYLGDDDGAMDFGKRLAPAANLTLGKYINPYFAVQANVGYNLYKGLGDGQTPYAKELMDNGYNADKVIAPYKEQFNTYTVNLEAVLQVSSLVAGPSDTRVWNLLLHAGPNYSYSTANSHHCGSAGVTAGLTSQWRLSSNVAVQATGRYTLYGKDFDLVRSANCMDGGLSLSIGVTYSWGKKSTRSSRTYRASGSTESKEITRPESTIDYGKTYTEARQMDQWDRKDQLKNNDQSVSPIYQQARKVDEQNRKKQ